MLTTPVKDYVCKIVYEHFGQGFGRDYPAALTKDGVRWPLERETRFIRYYRIPEPRLPRQNTEFEISRFVDGTASLTLTQLETEWESWSAPDRMDFCRSIYDLQLLEQPDLPAMVRFVVHHANPEELSCLAPQMECVFPPNETYALLEFALQNSGRSRISNIVQAMARTKHPDAEATVRRQLQSIWADSSLWSDASFVNWIALDALICIQALIQISARPEQFADSVRKLSKHSCTRIQKQCRSSFAEHYYWLNE